MPPPRTEGRKYNNCKQEPDTSVLDRDVNTKLKRLDPQLEVGEVIIPDGTLRYHVRYATNKAMKRGLSSIIYLKYFTQGKTKTLTTELYRVYIEKLITLRD